MGASTSNFQHRMMSNVAFRRSPLWLSVLPCEAKQASGDDDEKEDADVRNVHVQVVGRLRERRSLLREPRPAFDDIAKDRERACSVQIVQHRFVYI